MGKEKDVWVDVIDIARAVEENKEEEEEGVKLIIYGGEDSGYSSRLHS